MMLFQAYQKGQLLRMEQVSIPSRGALLKLTLLMHALFVIVELISAKHIAQAAAIRLEVRGV
ncbi:hypothetical protein HN51_028523 [Arachis hypogaea]